MIPHSSLLFAFVGSHLWWGYVLVFVGMIFEGDAFLFVAAFLAQEGYFDEVALFTIVIASLTVGSALWYWCGLRLHGTFLHRWAEKAAKPFDEHIIHRTFRTLLISKFMYGVHHFLLLRAGTMKISFGRYMKDSLGANFLWMAAVGSLGYFAGASFMLIRHYLKFVEVALFFALLIFMLAWHHIVSERLKKEL